MTRTDAIAMLRVVSFADVNERRTTLQLMNLVDACQALGLPIDLTAPMKKAQIVKALVAIGTTEMRSAAVAALKADEAARKKASRTTISAAEVNDLLAAMPAMETAL